jgi:arylsulfatase A-like enzyme
MNVLFITADQWRADCLGALDHPVLKTPNLDTLAADGVLFRNHFAQCTPCGPSRASLLTGMYLMNHRSIRNGTPLDARFSNIALEARAAGYDPGLIGYTDTSPDPRQHHANDPILKNYSGILPGFKQLVPGSEAGSSGSRPWIRELTAKGYVTPEKHIEIYKPVANGTGEPKDNDPPLYSAADSDTAFMVNHAITAIGDQKGTPWFLHLSLLRPHPPLVAPEPYNKLYNPAEVPPFHGAISPELEANSHPYAAYMARHHLDHEWLKRFEHPQEEGAMRQLKATYYGLISEVDDQIGCLIAFLKESGQYDDTLIVFTSDHGEQMWDHWVLGKQHFYDQSFHIPLIIRSPCGVGDNIRGKTVREFTESVDIMPTILDMINQEIPPQCDGKSLQLFLLGQVPEAWRTEVHWELDFRDNKRASAQKEMDIKFEECSLCVIRDHQFKYIHFAALPPLFFDIENDPGESKNLADDPDYAPILLSYAQKMLTWRLTNADRTLANIYLGPEGALRATQ